MKIISIISMTISMVYFLKGCVSFSNSAACKFNDFRNEEYKKEAVKLLKQSIKEIIISIISAIIALNLL